MLYWISVIRNNFTSSLQILTLVKSYQYIQLWLKYWNLPKDREEKIKTNSAGLKTVYSNLTIIFIETKVNDICLFWSYDFFKRNISSTVILPKLNPRVMKWFVGTFSLLRFKWSCWDQRWNIYYTWVQNVMTAGTYITLGPDITIVFSTECMCSSQQQFTRNSNEIRMFITEKAKIQWINGKKLQEKTNQGQSLKGLVARPDWYFPSVHPRKSFSARPTVWSSYRDTNLTILSFSYNGRQMSWDSTR